MSKARHDRVSALFAQAIELDLAQRRRLLDEVRAQDAELAAEIEELLVIDERHGDALGTAQLAPTPETRPSSVEPAPPPEIAGYRITGVLGRGGMGVVYAAEQRSPQRPVALKVLHATSATALGRFLLEAEILGRLDHPGIARVFEAGDAKGQPFLVMERVEGLALDAHLREHEPSLAARLTLMCDICEAVHHAHMNGVIHRDLKPSNVLVRPDGRVVVLDFGVARVAGSNERTRAGDLLGTPIYMSPEQARLRPDEVDARSDVYTLGVIACELCAGDLPYPVRGRPLPEIARVICEAPPRVGSDVDDDLAAILTTALAKEPGDRYQSASAMADDLRRYLAHEPVWARRPGALEQVMKFVRRRPGVAAAVAGFVAVVSVAVALTTWLWLDARAAHLATERARRLTERRADDLTLLGAHVAVERDPTEALARLKTLSGDLRVADEAWLIANAAIARGAARDLLIGHDEEVRWVEFLADPRWMVTGSYDGRAALWDRERRVASLVELGGAVRVIRASPDGRRILASTGSGRLVLLSQDLRFTELLGHGADVQAIEWSKDGALVASADGAGQVRIWRADGRVVAKLSGPTSAIESMSLSPDGTAVVVGDKNGRIWHWQLGSGARAHVFAHRGEVLAVRVSRDEVTSAGADGAVRSWRKKGQVLALEREQRVAARLTAAAVTPAGDRAALGGEDGILWLVSLGGSASPLLLGRHAAAIRALALAPSGDLLASGSDDGIVQLRRVDGGAGYRVLRGHAWRIRHLAFSRDGSLLASAAGDGEVRVWFTAPPPMLVLPPNGATIERLAAAGNRIAAASSDGAVRSFGGTGHGRELARHSGRARDVLIDGSGAVISGGDDGQILEARADGSVAVLARVASVQRLALSSDGAWLAVATEQGPIWIIGRDGPRQERLSGHEGGTTALAFAPRRPLLASGGEDAAVRVWRLDGAEIREVAVLEPFTDDVRQVAFSPDGRYLAATGDDGRVWAWRLHGPGVARGSGREVGRHHGRTQALAFAGLSLLVTAGVDRTARAVDLTTGETWKARLRTTVPAGIVAGAGQVDIIDPAGWLERWQPGQSLQRGPLPLGATTGALAPGGGIAIGYGDGSVHRHLTGAPTPGALRERLSRATRAELGTGGRPTARWHRRAIQP